MKIFILHSCHISLSWNQQVIHSVIYEFGPKLEIFHLFVFGHTVLSLEIMSDEHLVTKQVFLDDKKKINFK